MKKTILAFGLILMTLFLTGCHTDSPNEKKEFNIVTSFYPMYIATSNIVDGVENIKLTNMTSPNVGCLHDYQLTTKDMNVLERADVFVINGGGMESFLEKAMSAYPEMKVVNASEGILEMHEEEEHEEHDHHEENDG